MDKKQQIEEMEKDIGKAVGLTYEGEHFVYTLHTQKYLAKALYAAGYRKQGDVVREFAGNLLEKIQPFCFSLIGREIKMIIMETVGEFCAKGE